MLTQEKLAIPPSITNAIIGGSIGGIVFLCLTLRTIQMYRISKIRKEIPFTPQKQKLVIRINPTNIPKKRIIKIEEEDEVTPVAD